MALSSRGFGLARLVVAGALAVCGGTGVLAQKPAAPASPAASAGKDQNPDAVAAQQAQNQEIETVVHAADAAMAAPPAATEIPITIQSDYLKAQAGRVWVPLTLTLDPSKTNAGPLTLYLRVTPRGMTAPPPPAADPAPKGKDKKKKDNKDARKDPKSATAAPAGPSYPYEDVAFMDLKPAAAGQPFRIQRGLGVPAGSYDLYVVVHERAGGGKLGVVKQPIDVPNFETKDLMISSVILAERVDQLPAPIATDQQSEHPYAFGQTEIVPSPEKKFKKSQELIVLFQIYNPTLSAEKKFSLEATYTFYRQDAGAEKRFNSTEPQVFNSDSMGPNFDPSGGTSSIQAGQGIPLQSFPDGNYRLEVKITDKQSGKVLTQSTMFQVTP